ncbi:hypothetical protein PV11_03216 [Exophiala sideris]|uniref:DUF7719 domain-containing protein n=1 Tax=Exophiala sideris TaxID=1016849 RepID=A0A0D1WFY8_9EURO|nr:hypothetical protein PV11_03216 [Exophiala sideris]
MNRKQRRAQDTKSTPLKSAEDIPLAKPDFTRPTTKTLYEIAAERQAELSGAVGKRDTNSGVIKPENVVHLKIGKDGQIEPQSQSPNDTATSQSVDVIPETPWLDAILLATSLSAVHFTLEVLTVHQYAQDLHFPPIIRHTIFVAWPTLTAIIALFHGLLFPVSLTRKTPAQILLLRQIVYVAIANVAGCYLINVTNDKGYYAVMKNAPGIGTIWVWSVLELGLFGALAGVVGPGIYAWWNHYGIF